MLGTGAMVPLPDRYLSSLLFRYEGALYLMDCGEGTQVTWRRFHWGFRRLEAIFLSHFHADHILGLPGLLHTLMHTGKNDPLYIVGPLHTKQVVELMLVIAPIQAFEIFVVEMADRDEITLPSGLRVRSTDGQHRSPVLAYRFEIDRQPAFLPDRATALGIPRPAWRRLQRGESVEHNGRTVLPDEVLSAPRPGLSFGFSTDTRPTDSIRQLMQGVDLLICEATYGDDAATDKAAERGHMTFREAATLARDARAGALWLTHFGAGMDRPENYLPNATAVFPKTTTCHEGLTAQLIFERGLVMADGSDSSGT